MKCKSYVRKSASVPGLIWARLHFWFFWILKTYQKNLKKIMRKHIHVLNTRVNFRQEISIFAPCVKKTNLSFWIVDCSPILSVRYLSFLHRAQKLIFSVDNLHKYWIHEYVSFSDFFKRFQNSKKSKRHPGADEPGSQSGFLKHTAV